MAGTQGALMAAAGAGAVFVTRLVTRPSNERPETDAFHASTCKQETRSKRLTTVEKRAPLKAVNSESHRFGYGRHIHFLAVGDDE